MRKQLFKKIVHFKVPSSFISLPLAWVACSLVRWDIALWQSSKICVRENGLALSTYVLRMNAPPIAKVLDLNPT